MLTYWGCSYIPVIMFKKPRIKEMISEEAPVNNAQKAVHIAKGYSADMDELRGPAFSGKDYLDKC